MIYSETDAILWLISLLGTYTARRVALGFHPDLFDHGSPTA